MDPVSSHKRGEVLFPVALKKHVVVAGLLRDSPCVEGLIEYVHAESVGRLNKDCGGCVVCRPDRVEAALLKQGKLSVFGVIERNRAEHAVVVMKAAALKLYCFPVDLKAASYVCSDRADAEKRGHGIRCFFSGGVRNQVGLEDALCADTCSRKVKRRLLGAPESGLIQNHLKARGLLRHGIDLDAHGALKNRILRLSAPSCVRRKR